MVQAYPHISKLQDDIRSIVKEHLMPEVNEVLLKEFNFIEELRNEIRSYHELNKTNKGSLQLAIDSRDRLHKKVTTAWLTPQPKELKEYFPAFYEALAALIEQTDQEMVEIQLKERFFRQDQDGTVLRIRKFWKRFFFKVSTIPRRIKNVFIKNKLPITYWKHSIPYRELSRHYIQNLFIRDIQNLSQLRNSKLASIYLEIKEAEERLFLSDQVSKEDLLIFNEPSKEEMLNQALLEIETSIEEDIIDLIRCLTRDYQKVGTIELKAKRFKENKVAKEVGQAEKLWSKTNYHWNNTLHALFEEWRTDLELYRLKYQTIAALENLKTEQQQRHKEQVISKIELINEFISEAKTILSSDSETSSKRLKKVLVQSKRQLDKKLVPSLVNSLSSKNYLGLLNNLEHVVRNHIEAMSDDHIITKTKEYNLPLSPNDISVTSPYELINFELLSAFEDQIKDVKSQLLDSIEKTTNIFRDIDHIIIFSISSALAVLEDQEEKEKEAIIIALEGIERASNRLTEGLEVISDGLEQTSEELRIIVDQFNESLVKLTDNDRVFELKMRITKAKALQQAEEVREKIKLRFIQSRKKFVSYITEFIPNITKAIQDIRGRFLLTAKTQELTREMSDFLLESQSAIENLPTIYRQLYKIEPLIDMEFFEGREKEIESFKKSLESWDKGRFSSTVIIGEKWGGQTSFLNYLEKVEFKSSRITRVVLPKNLSTEKQVLELLKSEINKHDLNSLEELIDELNDGRKRIIILEDLQNMFTRNVGGFAGLNFLFRLISQTGINVFWISTTTFYSWSYLEKTVKINEFFSYIIEMSPFSNDQIKSIIWKRNNISGFQIRFEADKQHLESKKFTKLSDEQQQKALENEFFKELCDFAKSNVTMALTFWLLSTNKVDSRQITIGTLKRPNLNLVGALSADKILILYSLILHDGLSESNLSLVQHISPQLAKMLLLSMEEDSIIISNDGIYTLNPLIYRDAIAILKTKNLIQ